MYDTAKSQIRVIGIDPGMTCGVAVLDDNQILACFNTNMTDIWGKINAYMIHPNYMIALEDIRPYSLPLTPDVLATAKFIGEAHYRLRMACGERCVLVTRSEVKKWVFDTFPAICLPRIAERIDKKLFDACEVLTRQEIRVNETGRPGRKPSHNYVNDQIVIAAMREYYKVPRKKKGEPAPFGLDGHSWQALGLASCVNAFNKI